MEERAAVGEVVRPAAVPEAAARVAALAPDPVATAGAVVAAAMAAPALPPPS